MLVGQFTIRVVVLQVEAMHGFAMGITTTANYILTGDGVDMQMDTMLHRQ